MPVTEGARTADRLEERARSLAARHRVLLERREEGAGLLGRLSEQQEILRHGRAHFAGSRQPEEYPPPPLAVWLLDNYYVLQQTFRLVREEMPPGYYRTLPKLGSAEGRGMPRVLAVAAEILHLGRTVVDLEEVRRFVRLYQEFTPLRMGELWALPVMLRFVCLETLAQAVARAVPRPAGTAHPYPGVAVPENLGGEEIVANCVIGLRALANQDWTKFFEELSVVDCILRRDPAGVFARMDFQTRDRYRGAVESLSRRAGMDEQGVAERAVELAAGEPRPDGRDGGRRSHVGHYLVGEGRPELETGLGIRSRRQAAGSVPLYLGSIGVPALLLAAAAARYASAAGADTAQAVGAFLLGLIPAITIAVELVNRWVIRLAPPRILPKLDFSEGIPDPFRSIVVVPALLAQPRDVPALLDNLELHYLRNPDPNLRFALLTDFADAPRPHMAEDEPLLDSAREGIRALNAKYADRSAEPFLFFHRRRVWNGREGCWMGWERKRGKLHEFNRLLLGRQPLSETVLLGDPSLLPTFRYVITLDADTVLPPGAARKLVGTLAHPLNRAAFDPRSGEVSAGYTILQPRTEIKPEATFQSPFVRLFAGEPGLDLYTLAVSDVYQDLFGEGTFVGKGIYDVAAFERSLEGKIPENTLLSHDLFEGVQGRVGLVTDVVLLEDYPPNYPALARRAHRWVRGDWQLLPWLLPRVPVTEDGVRSSEDGTAAAEGGWAANPLSLLDRWKIADNLRRSLVMPALLALLAAGWLWLPGSPPVWTLFALLTLAVAPLSQLFQGLAGLLRGAFPRAAFRPAGRAAVRAALALVFLPYEALSNLHAIGLTLIRVLLTRRSLLRWTASARFHADFGAGGTKANNWRQLAPAVGAAGLLLAGLVLRSPASLPAAAPLLLAWLLSPEAADRLGRLRNRRPEEPSAGDREELHALARRSWLFFERFVDPENQWLPPDHFQEHPRGTVAHRTSPTNIGLMLLSVLGAYDFGYVGPLNMVRRLENAFRTIGRLEQGRGHLFNWYDTRTLAPLPPRYISTVDSGNLGACLVALRQGCLQLAGDPFPHPAMRQGILDTLLLLRQTLRRGLGGGRTPDPAPLLRPLLEPLEAMIARVRAAASGTGSGVPLLVSGLEPDWKELQKRMIALVLEGPNFMEPAFIHELRVYAELVGHTLALATREVDTLLPWNKAFREPPALLGLPAAPPELLDGWAELRAALPDVLPLDRITAACAAAADPLAAIRAALRSPAPAFREALEWCADLESRLQAAAAAAAELQEALAGIGAQAEALVGRLDFRFLFDPQRQVFHIGYDLETERLDPNHYDLLASEARVASFLAIAKGDVPQRHWLHLSRPFSRLESGRALLSWSGTMFEYLMPVLLMRHRPGTVLHESCLAAVDHQIRHGQRKGIPWGVSEAAFYSFDPQMGYQYQAFGVPGLGLKRGLEEDTVIAPYASALAVGLRPAEVLKNLALLSGLCMEGVYGLYESLDYTPSRLALGHELAVVRSYYAHHTGMIFLALGNFLHADRMVRRFHSDPRIRSVEMLLEERSPDRTSLLPTQPEEAHPFAELQPHQSATPWPVPIQSPLPRVHLLSNGRYGVLLTSAGGGYSFRPEMDLTRWRADGTLDDWGTWIYLQDPEEGLLWSAGHQPTGVPSPNREVLFSPYHAEFHRRDHDISLRLEVTVPPEQSAEVRRLSLTNHSGRRRRLRITSYGEPILAPQAADERHPAFSKLFIESRFLPELNALLFRRRPRSSQEKPAWLLHQLVPAEEGSGVTFESSRERFLGRWGTPRSPAALAPADGAQRLPGTAGATLDPVMVLGQEVVLEPYGSARLAFLTIAADSEGEARTLAYHFRPWSAIERSFEQARLHSERAMHRRGSTPEEISLFGKLLSALLYPASPLRAAPDVLAANRLGQPGLWRFGLSGDDPILLARLSEARQLSLAQELLRAHSWFRHRGMKVDLVLWDTGGDSYSRELPDTLRRMVANRQHGGWLNRRGGIYLLSSGQMSEAERTLLVSAARVVLDGSRGPLAAQLRVLDEPVRRLPALIPSRPAEPEPAEPEPAATPEAATPDPAGLLFDNGTGGFQADGREYVIRLGPGGRTPAPWINVVANAGFGFTVSEAGSGYTWCQNSGENRLTPWGNDPVSDRPGEALYLRDEETGQVWSPTPLPAGPPAAFQVRHGAGYSLFRHSSHGLAQELRLFAAREAPLKILHLTLENRLERPRRLTATFYAEWVLGPGRERMQPYILPEYDRESPALLACNPYNADFPQRFAFVSASESFHGLTADRTEFLGRMGSLSRPAGLGRIGLSGAVQPGPDPCAAVQVHLNLEPGGSRTVHFLLGQGSDREEALRLVREYRQPAAAQAAWREAREGWEEMLGAVQVRTPEPSMDLLLNRWLPYQNLACRFWGRSGFYQSSGAFGFRDQLQDSLALLHLRPDLAREHLLRAARHQFEAGDVLHWWHPPHGRGVRTRVSDDLLWLPFVTAHYVEVTGDRSVLREQVPYLRADVLGPEEEERYGLFGPTPEAYTLYEHCRRALGKGDTAGRHGLPLMGGGDWNDGMNRVGIGGKGESVWLGWFLYACLTRFAPLCTWMGDAGEAERLRRRAEELRGALEESAWDGAWYRRAWFDDGTPLGSARNRECRIDSVAQSWAVLSGAGDPQRTGRAMEAVAELLVRPDDRLILLFTPPFDATPQDPGYIKGYLPGIRENGGQYTHAAMWTAWAFSELGQGDRAESLFRLLNPILHSDSPQGVARYRLEPYVVAADIYSVPPHVGRGGWNWYTGSAGWMYRLGLEAILGFHRQGAVLQVDPCIPAGWKGFEIAWRLPGTAGTTYRIRVDNPEGVCRGVKRVTLDGKPLPRQRVPLPDDGAAHEVQVLMGSSRARDR